MNPYVILAAILGLGGALVGAYFRGEHAANASWEARWTAQEAAYARVAAEAVAKNREALTAAQQRNTEVMNALNDVVKARDAALADADFARRLLHAAGSPGSGPLLQASHFPGAVEASGAGSGAAPSSLLADVTDAIGECRRNADRLDALIAELKPQL